MRTILGKSTLVRFAREQHIKRANTHTEHKDFNLALNHLVSLPEENSCQKLLGLRLC